MQKTELRQAFQSSWQKNRQKNLFFSIFSLDKWYGLMYNEYR